MECPKCHSKNVKVTVLGNIEKTGTYVVAAAGVVVSKIILSCFGIQHTKTPSLNAFINGTDELGVPRQCKCKNCGYTFHVRYENESTGKPMSVNHVKQETYSFEFSITDIYQRGKWVVLRGRVQKGSICVKDDIYVKKQTGQKSSSIIDRISYTTCTSGNSMNQEEFHYIDKLNKNDAFSNDCYLYLKNIDINEITLPDKIVEISSTNQNIRNTINNFSFSIIEMYKRGKWVVVHGTVENGFICAKNNGAIIKKNGKRLTCFVDRISYIKNKSEEEFKYVEKVQKGDSYSTDCFLYLMGVDIKDIKLSDKVIAG